MLLEKCKGCSRTENSTNAQTYPNCKKQQRIGLRRKTLIGFCIVSIPILSLLAISNISYSAEHNSSRNSINKNYTFNSYRFSDKEQAVLKTILIEDFYTWYVTKGKGSSKTLSPLWQRLIGEKNIVKNNAYVTADQLQRVYENNEVAGNQKYKGKTLFISGIVASINSGQGKNHYLSLVGGTNMFMQPHAYMADGFENYLANLNKGESVSLVCQGIGMVMGSAIINHCIPTNIWAEKQINNFPKLINKLDKFLLVYFMAIASALPESSSCSEAGSYKFHICQTEINEASNNKINESTLEDAARKLKIDFAEIKEYLNKMNQNKD